MICAGRTLLNGADCDCAVADAPAHPASASANSAHNRFLIIDCLRRNLSRRPPCHVEQLARESSELRRLRTLEFDGRVEGVLARVIEVQIRRQDFHYRGSRALRDAPDESLRQVHLDVVLLARDRVCEGREADLEHPWYREAALLTRHRHLDWYKLGIENIAHRLTEQREGSATTGAAVSNIANRLALLLRRFFGDVYAGRAVTLMNRVWPGGGIDKVQAVERRFAVAARADVIADQRFASPARGEAVEIARTAEIAITRFH